MKGMIFAALLGACLVGLVGCSAQDSLDLKPFTATWTTIGPEYRAFLSGTPPAYMAADAKDREDKIRARIMLCDELDAIAARRGK